MKLDNQKTTGCVICGKELQYITIATGMDCNICGKPYLSNARCKDGHFICDSCHSMDATDYIETFCNNTNSINPSEIATELMMNNKIKMHGPEHHFLVPAVLISSYYNKTGETKLKAEKLRIAKNRSSKVLGGFCGFYGSCGACIGNGISMSVILNSTPLSENEWKLGNKLTAKSLSKVADHGGPRCCKRDTYIAIETAVDFISTNLNVELESSEIVCGFHHRNKECLEERCLYHPAAS